MTATALLNAESPLRPILLVKDNDWDLDFCVQAFEEHALANPLLACRDGEAAQGFIDAHPSASDPLLPLLVLLDLRLPKIDGIDVLRHARRRPVWDQVPFVALTTSHESADIEKAYKLGVNSYIVKPVEFADFSAVIHRIRLYWVLTNRAPFSGN